MKHNEPAPVHSNPAVGRAATLSDVWATVVVIAGFIALVCLGGMALRGLHSNDFRHIYLGMQAMLDGDEPYTAPALLLAAGRHGLGNESLNPYVYLPFTGLSLAFMRPLPFPVAAQLWLGLNVAFAICAAWLMAHGMWPRDRGRRRVTFGCLMLAMAFNHPMLRTLTAGQLNCVLLLCYAGAFAALSAGRDTLSGALLGYAAMFKLAPGLFILYLPLVRKWRALAAMLVTCAILLVVSLIAVGWDVHAAFVPMLRQMSYGHSTWEQHRATFWKDPANQSPNALLTHMLVAGNGKIHSWVQSTQTVANAATWAVSLSLLALYLAGILRGRRGEQNIRASTGAGDCFGADLQAAYMSTIMLSLLVPSLMWDHYLVLAVLPAAWLLTRELSSGRSVAATTTATLYVLTAIPWNFDALAGGSGAAVLLMSLKLFPAVGLFVQACFEAMRESQRGPSQAAAA